ncbi:MAG TPA: LysR family transcriptional regulator [Steroidobacteraceae bacterium]|nr:LysR family transcriptional regulator [Steroidobacteraceae bacterium]
MNTNCAPFDWTLMRSFLAVIERGSLLGAARHLGISQPTLGRHVAALERQLGVALFERTGRGLVATASARAIADQARAMADTAEAISRVLAGQSTQLEGSVRVSASQIVAVHLLPPLLARFREQEPGIAVEVTVSNALSNLLRREADIAIRMLRPVQSSLVARRIGDIRMGAYATRDYIRRRGIPRKPGDLLRHDLIGLDRDDAIIRALASVGHRVDREAFSIRSDDHLLIWEALLAGLGIGFAATWLADREPSLESVLPDVPMPTFPVWLAVHREIRSSARIRALYDFLSKAIPAALTSTF